MKSVEQFLEEALRACIELASINPECVIQVLANLAEEQGRKIDEADRKRINETPDIAP